MIKNSAFSYNYTLATWKFILVHKILVSRELSQSYSYLKSLEIKPASITKQTKKLLQTSSS